jgi:RNA polymerase sigma-70 factor (ECF subfamily)
MAIRLRHFAGQPLSEIAEAMQLTEINVRQLLSRGRKTLKEKMKKYVYGE